MKKARKSDSKKHSKPLKTIEIQKKSNIRPEIIDSQEKGGAILVNPRIYGGLINENQVDEWVRGNALIAQGTIVELLLTGYGSCP